ncbi:MAG: hypothetical protein JXM68_04050, partial [Sedimentisphaerales bacterium]|nr:hypothetical protein [Sedimentisphaerales bacterium]
LYDRNIADLDYSWNLKRQMAAQMVQGYMQAQKDLTLTEWTYSLGSVGNVTELKEEILKLKALAGNYGGAVSSYINEMADRVQYWGVDITTVSNDLNTLKSAYDLQVNYYTNLGSLYQNNPPLSLEYAQLLYGQTNDSAVRQTIQDAQKMMILNSIGIPVDLATQTELESYLKEEILSNVTRVSNTGDYLAGMTSDDVFDDIKKLWLKDAVINRVDLIMSTNAAVNGLVNVDEQFIEHYFSDYDSELKTLALKYYEMKRYEKVKYINQSMKTNSLPGNIIPFDFDLSTNLASKTEFCNYLLLSDTNAGNAPSIPAVYFSYLNDYIKNKIYYNLTNHTNEQYSLSNAFEGLVWITSSDTNKSIEYYNYQFYKQMETRVSNQTVDEYLELVGVLQNYQNGEDTGDSDYAKILNGMEDYRVYKDLSDQQKRFIDNGYFKPTDYYLYYANDMGQKELIDNFNAYYTLANTEKENEAQKLQTMQTNLQALGEQLTLKQKTLQVLSLTTTDDSVRNQSGILDTLVSLTANSNSMMKISLTNEGFDLLTMTNIVMNTSVNDEANQMYRMLMGMTNLIKTYQTAWSNNQTVLSNIAQGSNVNADLLGYSSSPILSQKQGAYQNTTPLSADAQNNMVVWVRSYQNVNITDYTVTTNYQNALLAYTNNQERVEASQNEYYTKMTEYAVAVSNYNLKMETANALKKDRDSKELVYDQVVAQYKYALIPMVLGAETNTAGVAGISNWIDPVRDYTEATNLLQTQMTQMDQIKADITLELQQRDQIKTQIDNYKTEYGKYMDLQTALQTVRKEEGPAYMELQKAQQDYNMTMTEVLGGDWQTDALKASVASNISVGNYTLQTFNEVMARGVGGNVVNYNPLTDLASYGKYQDLYKLMYGVKSGDTVKTACTAQLTKLNAQINAINALGYDIHLDGISIASGDIWVQPLMDAAEARKKAVTDKLAEWRDRVSDLQSLIIYEKSKNGSHGSPNYTQIKKWQDEIDLINPKISALDGKKAGLESAANEFINAAKPQAGWVEMKRTAAQGWLEIDWGQAILFALIEGGLSGGWALAGQALSIPALALYFNKVEDYTIKKDTYNGDAMAGMSTINNFVKDSTDLASISSWQNATESLYHYWDQASFYPMQIVTEVIQVVSYVVETIVSWIPFIGDLLKQIIHAVVSWVTQTVLKFLNFRVNPMDAFLEVEKFGGVFDSRNRLEGDFIGGGWTLNFNNTHLQDFGIQNIVNSYSGGITKQGDISTAYNKTANDYNRTSQALGNELSGITNAYSNLTNKQGNAAKYVVDVKSDLDATGHKLTGISEATFNSLKANSLTVSQVDLSALWSTVTNKRDYIMNYINNDGGINDRGEVALNLFLSAIMSAKQIELAEAENGIKNSYTNDTQNKMYREDMITALLDTEVYGKAPKDSDAFKEIIGRAGNLKASAYADAKQQEYNLQEHRWLVQLNTLAADRDVFVKESYDVINTGNAQWQNVKKLFADTWTDWGNQYQAGISNGIAQWDAKTNTLINRREAWKIQSTNVVFLGSADYISDLFAQALD